MGRRREEKVDVEELARLESPEGGTGGKIRVKMPNKKVNEMFALAEQILGGRRVSVLCADGETRLARIPGKMRRRQWVREGDLIIVWPWDFQDAKADVKHRYTKTQSMYLSRKGVLPEVVDMYGMNTRQDDDEEFDDLFGNVSDMDEESAADEAAEDTIEDVVDETDDLSASEEESTEEQSQPEVVEEEPTQVIADEPLDDDDDDDDDIDALFA
jgi:translation initiation factor 1A